MSLAETFRWIGNPFYFQAFIVLFSVVCSVFFSAQPRNRLMTNSSQFSYLWLIFLLLSSGGRTNRSCRKQKGVGKKSKGKLTFSLNEGGTGHRDAAVTMQGKLLFFLSCSLALPSTLKQDLWPHQHHHILATDAHCGWFIWDWGLCSWAYQCRASVTYNVQQEVTKRTLCHQLVTSVWSTLAFIEAWRLFSRKILIFFFLFAAKFEWMNGWLLW